MSPAYTTREQYERYHIRDCVRCGRTAAKAANWEGPICRTCYDRAVRCRGRCPHCHAQRLLPGRRPDGTPICRDCAGITRDFFCDRCGFEGCLLGGRLCERCTLTDKLTALLDDGTGQVRTELLPLLKGVCATNRPKRALSWLEGPQVRELLASMASGALPITHEALTQLPNWRTASFLRELLAHHGVLPMMDKQLMLFERWLPQRLAAIDDPHHARLVSRFATWNELRRLRARAGREQLRSSTAKESRQRINRAADFLAWLTQRDKNLPSCTQADVDAWHTENPVTRRPAQPFLRWAMAAGLMPSLSLPQQTWGNPAPLSQRRRLELIRKLIRNNEIPLPIRVAGLLVLFYAQPVSRIVQLETSDLILDEDTVLLRIGDPPTPAPEPLAGLLRELVAQRAVFQGPGAETTWLFPGQRAGQPRQARAFAGLLRHHSIPVQAGRTSALRQLVLQAPAPVVASMLGFHDKHTARLVAEGGGTWSRYSADEATPRRKPSQRHSDHEGSSLPPRERRRS